MAPCPAAMARIVRATVRTCVPAMPRVNHGRGAVGHPTAERAASSKVGQELLPFVDTKVV